MGGEDNVKTLTVGVATEAKNSKDITHEHW